MKNRKALKCTLGVVVVALFLAVTWSATAARLSAWTNSSSAVKPNSPASAPKKLTALHALVQSTATVATDKSDYHPGETVTVTGSGWAPGEQVTLSFAETPVIDGPHVIPTNYANDQGNISNNQFVVDLFDGGISFTLTATGAASGQTATATFTDSQPPDGTGVVTVTSNNPTTTCIAFTAAQAGGPDSWEVVQGGSYTMTITGVTECTGDAITMFLQGSATGNFCFNAVKISAGTYEGAFTMPNPACFTYPISYKCSLNQPCSNANTFNANGPSNTHKVHLRASTFDTGCTNPTQDEVCTGGGPQGCTLTAPDGGDLGCNPTPSAYACGTASGTGCVAPPVCTPGVPVSTGGCSWKVVNTYTCTGADGFPCTQTQTFTFTQATAPVFTGCTTGTTDLGCNPTTLPSCDDNVTASNECGTVHVDCAAGEIHTNGCNRSQDIVYTATACGLTSTCTKSYTWTVATAPVFDNCTTGTTDLGCNPTPPSCATNITAHNECGPVTVTCEAGTIVSTGCNRSQDFVYTATACHLTSTCTKSFTWTVDTTPPVITCPTDITVNAGGACCAVANFEATATDTCSTANVRCVPPSGSCFPVGTTQVNCGARDRCGNHAECSFNVIVKGQICATKFYDSNGNGARDDGEVGVSGWKMTVSNGSNSVSNTTDSNGNVCFDVVAGTYTVTEGTPNEGNWVATTSKSCQVTISSSNCTSTCTFGNYCKATGGLTLGFWTNRNGQNILANNPGWVALLNNPCGGGAVLRNANGTIHTFTTYADLKTWLNGATATNMAYMLSAQLAANLLDTYTGSLNASTGVLVPGGVKTQAGQCIVPFLSVSQLGVTPCDPALLTLAATMGSTACGCSSKDGLTTIGLLQAKACCLLGAYGSTVLSGTPRTYEECVKDILDIINNNGNPTGSSAYPCGPSPLINPPGTCPATF